MITPLSSVLIQFSSIIVQSSLKCEINKISAIKQLYKSVRSHQLSADSIQFNNSVIVAKFISCETNSI